MKTSEESDEAQLHAMIARACFGAGSEEVFTRDLRGFLEEAGVGAEDVEAIVASPPRLALYRRLIRNNVVGVTEKMLARTRARMNEIGGAFDATFDEWLSEVGPRTHYLRDVPHEMFAWAAPRWRARADVPAWLVDLAGHELSEYALSAAPAASVPPPVTDVALDRAVVLAEPLQLLRYAFRVHELPADAEDRSAPREGKATLLGYRDAEHAVRFLELTPLAASIAEHLVAGDTLGDAISRACTENATAPGEAVLADVARLLADFGERGILLGGRT